jgi:hypothetical protein
MNLAAIESRAKKVLGVMFRAKFPEGPHGIELDYPEYYEKKARIDKFLGVLRLHATFMKKRQARLDRIADQHNRLSNIAQILNDGMMILSFDVEQNARHGFQEVGLTTYSIADGFVSVNLKRIDAEARRIKFDFGRTKNLPLNILLQKVHDMANKCHYYVGHSIKYDIGYLQILGADIPEKPVLDTHLVSVVTDDMEGKSLSDLAASFGVAAPNPHCGGNDARYNMELALAMIEKYVGRTKHA